MHKETPALNLIWPDQKSVPFRTISMDLITKLLKLEGFDSILTITDQGYTKAALVIPCKETMGTKEMAKLYLTQVFPFIGIPSKLISDQDTRFTSRLFKEICNLLQIKQNISSVYHLQTD